MPTMRVDINNGEEEVDVDDDTVDNFCIDSVAETKEAAFKCGECKRLAVHTGVEVTVGDIMFPSENKTHRYYCCTNCGRFGKR